MDMHSEVNIEQVEPVEKKKKTKKSEGIIYTKPTLSKRELKSVLECMVQDEITFGRVVQNLEKEFATSFEFQKAISASSMTSGYHLALLALNCNVDSEIILPANAPVSALDAIGQIGAKPVLVDIAKNSFHPDIESITSLFNDNTRAVLLCYPYGSFKSYEPLYEYLNSDQCPSQIKKQVKIIEDISYIAGIEHQGRYVGAEADIAIIGLDADMLITTGKGAMVLTDSKTIYSNAKDFRLHGNNRPYKVRYDYTITDYQAAMGIEQLGNLAQILERRKLIGHKYIEALQNSNLDTFLHNPKLDSYGQFPIIMNNDIEHGLRYFQSLNIEVKRANEYGPLHNLMGLPATEFANAERVYQRTLLLPIYPYLTKSNVERIVGAIKSFY